jgi:hypothetical protein
MPKSIPEVGAFNVGPKSPSPAAKALEAFLGGTTPAGGIVTPPAPVTMGIVDAPAAPPPAAVSAPPLAPAPTPDELALEEALNKASLSPAQTYPERIATQGITLDEAHAILDSLLTKGTYERAYQVTSKIKVTFRTRLVEDNEKLFGALEKEEPAFSITQSSFVSRFNLAASLVSIGSNKFENNDEGREKAHAFIMRLPAFIFVLLTEKLAKFDRLIGVVADEGAVENF